MGTPAPKPVNLRAMSDAWDNPVAFAKELAQYYQQLELSGYRAPTRNIYEPREPG